MNITINEIIPEGGSVTDLHNLPKAWFNLVLYREVRFMTAINLEKKSRMPYISITQMGIVDTTECIRQLQKHVNNLMSNKFFDYEPYIDQQISFISQAAWFSRFIDCQILTREKAIVLGV